MFLDLKDIRRDGVDFSLRAETLEVGDDRDGGGVVRGAEIRGRVSEGPRGLELSARVVATFEVPCDRCLEAVRSTLEEDVFLVLSGEPLPDEPGEIEIEVEDTEIFPVRDDRIDLTELLREQVLLLLPVKSVCRPDCKGLCPECGVDRNRTSCDCGHDAVDPRLAPLARFRSSGEG